VAGSDSDRSSDEEFESLCANYLNMLYEDEEGAAEGCTPLAVPVHEPSVPGSEDDVSVIDVRHGPLSAPQCSPLEEDFLTSPFRSPYDEVLVTPAMDFAESSSSIFTSTPAVGFGDGNIPPDSTKHPKDVPPAFDGLYCMPSPTFLIHEFGDFANNLPFHPSTSATSCSFATPGP